MGHTILIVEDSKSMRKLVAYTLIGAGHDVLEAADGKEALSRLNSESVDMIISDLNMPNMDGLQLLKLLRGSAAYKFTPIIMLTTEAQVDKVMQAKMAGVSGWIVKPFQPEKLLQTVKKFLR